MNTINWKLIFQLSLFGLAMAIATVFWIPSKIEWLFWVIIFVFCAYRIAKTVPSKFFLHGFLVSLANCVWITCIHAIMFKTYSGNHPEIMQMSANMPMHDHPRRAMVVFGPIFGILSGIVLGLFSWIASKIVKNNSAIK